LTAAHTHSVPTPLARAAHTHARKPRSTRMEISQPAVDVQQAEVLAKIQELASCRRERHEPPSLSQHIDLASLGLVARFSGRSRLRRKGISLSNVEAETVLSFADRFRSQIAAESRCRLQQRRNAVCGPIRLGERRRAIGGGDYGAMARLTALKEEENTAKAAQSMLARGSLESAWAVVGDMAAAAAWKPQCQKRESAWAVPIDAAWKPQCQKRESMPIDWAAMRLAIQTAPSRGPSATDVACC